METGPLIAQNRYPRSASEQLFLPIRAWRHEIKMRVFEQSLIQ
jgi:hypothetical protein